MVNIHYYDLDILYIRVDRPTIGGLSITASGNCKLGYLVERDGLLIGKLNAGDTCLVPDDDYGCEYLPHHPWLIPPWGEDIRFLFWIIQGDLKIYHKQGICHICDKMWDLRTAYNSVLLEETV